MRKRFVIVFTAMVGIASIAIFLMVFAQPRYEGRSVESWILQLGSIKPHAHDQAVLALQKLGPRIVPTAVKMIAATNYSPGDKAYLALLPHLPLHIRKSLVEKYYPIQPDHVRGDAVMALYAVGPDGRAAMPVLISLLGTPHKQFLSYDAGLALCKIGKDAVQPMLGRLRENDPEVRRTILFTLGELGPDAGPALPTLVAGLRDTNAEIRLTAEQALDRLGLVANPALLEMLRSQDPTNREIAARMFTVNLQMNDDVVPALIEATHDPVAAVRKQAIESLRQICPAYQPAIAAFTGALADNDPAVRSAAAQALGHPAN